MKWNSERRQIVLLGALMLTAISLGCSKSDLAAIKGRVKFKNGEAIKFDRSNILRPIVLQQINRGQKSSTASTRFRVKRACAPGSTLYESIRLRFCCLHDKAGGSGLKLPEERVSAKFNTESNLVIEVNHEAIQTFDFEVE